jgi:DNA topoisomerase-1
MKKNPPSSKAGAAAAAAPNNKRVYRSRPEGSSPSEQKKKRHQAAAAAEAVVQRHHYLKCDHTLVIVESPSKCAKIESILGSDKFKVVASKGHLYEIGGLRDIDLKTMIPNYRILASKNSVVDTLGAEIERAGGGVILATDADREGEAIAHHICLIFNLNPLTTPRIVFGEITPAAILHAVRHPRTIDMNLVAAQRSRAVLDLLVGFKLSPLLWRYIGQPSPEKPQKKIVTLGDHGHLSAGRCQTPALRIIHDDHMARSSDDDVSLSSLVDQLEYQVHATYSGARNVVFHLKNGHFPVTAAAAAAAEDKDPHPQITSFLDASKTFRHQLSPHQCVRKQSVLSPPLPLNTSALIQTMGSKNKLSPKETMSICQTLYQQGYITYMRTDSRKFAAPFIESLTQFVAKTYGEKYIGTSDRLSRMTSAGSNGGAGSETHEAIRPTNIATVELPDTFTPRHKSVYRCIRQIALQCVMTDAVYDVYTLHVTSPVITMHYEGHVETPIHTGWKLVGGELVEEEIDPAFQHFRLLLSRSSGYGGEEEGEKTNAPLLDLPFSSIEAMVTPSSSGRGTLGPHYTESTLVKKLEDLGIGRPSTFSSLVDVIQSRGYVAKTDIPGVVVSCRDYRLSLFPPQKLTFVDSNREFGAEKNKLVLQPLGARVIEFLLRHFEDVFSYSYTASMEDRLDRVARGEESPDGICLECLHFLKSNMAPVNQIYKQKFVLRSDVADDQGVYEVVFTKTGPAIQYTPPPPPAAMSDPTSDPTPIYKAIKSSVNLDVYRLAAGGYTVQDLLAFPNDCLGQHEGFPLMLKSGPYGLYVEWGDHRASLRNMQLSPGQTPDTITLGQVLSFLQTPSILPTTVDAAAGTSIAASKNVLRVVNPSLSIRKGRYGPYLFYQTVDMPKPAMIGLRKFKCPEGYMGCSESVLMTYIEQHRS